MTIRDKSSSSDRADRGDPRRPLVALLGVLVVFLLSNVACFEPTAWEKAVNDAQIEGIKICTKAGGIPIFSQWTATLVDCKRPEVKP